MRVDPTYLNNVVSALDNVQANEEQYTSELSSGVSLTSISTNPVAAGENVLLLNEIQQDDSFTSSANQSTGQLQVADSVLGSAVTQITQAISLATAANNGTENAGNEQSLANELEGIRSELITLANSNYQGQYIFAGSLGSTAPFVTAGTTVNYVGDNKVNYLVTPNNQKIQLNVPGGQIFNNVFSSLDSLISDYSSVTSTTPLNTTQAATDTASLNNALTSLSGQRVLIDNSITQISAAESAVSSEGTQLTSVQTTLIQADVAGVSTQISTSQTQVTALEDLIASLGSDSLFSKLPN